MGYFKIDDKQFIHEPKVYFLLKKRTINFETVEFHFIWNALKIFFRQKCQMDVHQLRIWQKLCQNLAQRFHSTTS